MNRDEKADRASWKFPFYYGSESETFSFYRIPKILFSSDLFSGLSTDAKILYGLLMDRMQLSFKNSWLDSEGKVFIYYPREEIMHVLGCGNKKAGQLLAELDDNRGIGLITRVHQGLGKPDRIYVRKCVLPRVPLRNDPQAGTPDGFCGPESQGDTKPLFSQTAENAACMPSSEVSKGHGQRCRNDTAGTVKTTQQEVSKGSCNKTDKNKTDKSETDRIVSEPGQVMIRAPSGAAGTDPLIKRAGYDGYDRCNGNTILEDYQDYRDYFEESCRMQVLKTENPQMSEVIDEILELLTETCASRKELIRVSGEEKPAQIVKSRLMKLDNSHIQYVLNCMKENTVKVRNIRQYMLTSLYNAPATIDSYYTAEVNHDLYGQPS